MKLEVGQVWTHHTGRSYKILSFAYDADAMVWHVIHQGEDGSVYTRTFNNFCGLKGVYPRFRLSADKDTAGSFSAPPTEFHLDASEAYHPQDSLDIQAHVPKKSSLPEADSGDLHEVHAHLSVLHHQIALILKYFGKRIPESPNFNYMEDRLMSYSHAVKE